MTIETIDLTPRGCTTPEGQARVSAAMKAFENSAATLANAAMQFFGDHRTILLDMARALPGGDNERDALEEDIHQIDALIADRLQAQEEFMRSVAGVPPEPSVPVVHDLGNKPRYEESDSEGPWALYVFGADGMHSGRQYFSRAEAIQYPGEEITFSLAKTRAELAIAAGQEVRVTDGGDFCVFHSVGGKTVHGEGFWSLTGK